MPALLLALLMVSQVPFPKPVPRPGGGPGSTPLPDQSTIQGEVRTREGEPIPLATVRVETRQDATRADQRGDAVGWPGALARVRHDGTFRVSVPGGSTFEVCASVPTRARQCQTVEVGTNDVQVVMFTF